MARVLADGGAQKEAEALDIEIRETSDSGAPIVVGKPDSEHSKVFRDIADRLMARLDGADTGKREMPKIVVSSGGAGCAWRRGREWKNLPDSHPP